MLYTTSAIYLGAGPRERQLTEFAAAEWLALVRRGGVVESAHRGHVVVADAEGSVHSALGSPRATTFVRSAIKPVQAVAALHVALEVGGSFTPQGLAIASASHPGSQQQQEQAAILLASVGLDEQALQCPASLPEDIESLILAGGQPRRLAHNCSGKHAAFLYAQTLVGADPARYLDADSPVQRAVRDHIADATGQTPLGPALDGCGAPAWRCSIAGLATAFARLASRGGLYAEVRSAMSTHPELIGRPDAADTILLRSAPKIVAKRGAEAVFAAGWVGPAGPLGVAVKILDGGERAAAAVAAEVLHALGAAIPTGLLSPLTLTDDRGGATLEVTGPTQSFAAA